MQGIAQQVLANPGKYSVEQLTQAVRNNIIPAYIAVPIIQDKLNQKKMMEASMAMAQPSPKQQPPVAQQVMAEAQAPQGVEALPSNLPTSMASGGIVAFDDGGEVERYADQGLVGAPAYGMQFSDLPAYKYADRDIGGPLSTAVINAWNSMTTPRNMRIDPVTQEPISIGEFLRRQEEERSRLYAPIAAAQVPPMAATPSTPTTSPQAQTAPARETPTRGIQDLVPQTRTPGIGLKMPTTPTLAPPAAMAMPEGSSVYDKTQEALKSAQTEIAARDAETSKEVAKAQEKVTGVAFEGYQKQLQKEAEEFGASKEEAKAMSIFKAGLAMMAGTSQHGLENIGRGALVGAENYDAAMKDIKKAQRENAKDMAYIEQARRAEQIGDRDKAIERLEKSRDARNSVTVHVADAMSKAYGVDRNAAMEIAKTSYTTAADADKARFLGQINLLGHQIGAEATLGAARTHAEATLGAARMRQTALDQLTRAQTANLRKDVDKQIANDPALLNSIQQQALASLKISKVPPPSDTAAFAKYQAQIKSIRDRLVATKVAEYAQGYPTSAAQEEDEYPGFVRRGVRESR